MADGNYYWSLFNQRTGHRIDGLRTVQAKSVICSFEQPQRQDWLAWREGLSDWQHISEFPELLGEQSGSQYLMPPVPPPIPEKFRANTGPGRADGQEFKVDRRMSARFKKRFLVFIEMGERSFQTFTEDVSMDGMRLRDPLPPGITGQFKVLIRRKQQGLDLLCRAIIEDDGGPIRRLRILTRANDDILRTWLLAPGDE
jgi:hypothetical protein